MRSGMFLVTILSIALLSSPSLAANYFKWTDENGVTHYSARKPVGHEAEVVRISAAGRSAQQEESQQSTQPAGAQTAGASRATESSAHKDEERCNWARTTLETLRNNHRVRVQEDNGELRYLTEEEKAEQHLEAEKAVEEAC